MRIYCKIQWVDLCLTKVRQRLPPQTGPGQAALRRVPRGMLGKSLIIQSKIDFLKSCYIMTDTVLHLYHPLQHLHRVMFYRVIIPRPHSV